MSSSNICFAVQLRALIGPVLVSLFLSLLPSQAVLAAASFTMPGNYGAGTSPFGIAVGDFNGDGKSDLAVANYDSGNVSILLNNGNGTFAGALNYATGGEPMRLAAGDFNGDGKLDVVVVNYASNTVSILLNTGNGSFASAINHTVGIGPVSVAVGDFNSDGKLDVAVANHDSNYVSILLGNGSGSFSATGTTYAANQPYFIVTADLDGDDNLDLAISKRAEGTVTIFRGNGDGSFATAGTYPAGNYPISGAVADFNADGILDLAYASLGTGDPKISVLLGTGGAAFAASVTYAAHGDNLRGIGTGDFNGDGKTDLVVAPSTGNLVSILLGNGDGTFASAASYPVGTALFAVDVADFNDDGKSDIAVADYSGNNVSILLNTSVFSNSNLSSLVLSSGALNPAFGSAPSYTATVVNAVSSITVTPTVASATATVKVNGSPVTTGNTSSAVNLNVGSNTIAVLVTAQDASTKTYSVTVTRLGPDAQAFDYAISNFKVVRNGQTIFDDSFTSTTPPAAPSFRGGTAASYSNPAGNFSPAIGGKLHLNSAAATISPAVSTSIGVSAQLITSKDAIDLTSGLKPGMAFDVSGTWDAVTSGNAPTEFYAIELGDWQGKICQCIRLGVQRQSDGRMLIRFWRVTIGGDVAENATTLGSATFSPGSNQQILLKLKKASASSNAVTASYAYLNGGVMGTEIPLAGTTDVFAVHGYAVASFKAFTPVAYANASGTSKNRSVTANVNVAGTHRSHTGNIYVAALYQGLVFFNNGTSWVPWTSGSFPAYASNVSLADRSINVLSNVDVSSLVGAIVLVGYGKDQNDLITNQAYNIVHAVQ